MMSSTITAIPPQIIQQAEMLRTSLDRGNINIAVLRQFLAKVESYNSPQKRRKKKNENLFQQQLDNLNRRTAKKSLSIK
jgi:Zn-finger nucleic acid-binding protein